MYSPSQFDEPRVDVMHALIAAHPLATLVTSSDAGLGADHIPLLLRPDGTTHGRLVGHVARVNPLCKHIESGLDVLAIFHGPECYISPHWYATKQAGGKVVPTWNYAVVHASGRMRFVEDASWLVTQLEELTAHNERMMAEPWKFSDAPADYTSRLVGAIVGVEIQITRLSGKWKTSQNQPEANRRSVIEGLQSVGSDEALAMAALVESRGKPLG